MGKAPRQEREPKKMPLHGELSPEQRFGRYRVLRKLGQGGMGAVYLAYDTQLERRVGLKIPRFSADENADVVQRFYREARLAATLDHPNICPVLDVGQVGGIHYLTMAYIEGRPLADLIRPGKPLAERQVAIAVRKLAVALQEAHARGVVHRDLKPSNIMINQRHEPVIMDFGLARRMGDDDGLTQNGVLLGTPAYMSPEQTLGHSDAIGPQSDMYSLGVVLYEMLTGQQPFRGAVAAVLAQIVSAEPSPPQTLRPDLDPRLAAIAMKAMAKKPEDRYQNLAAMAAALTEFLKASPQPVSSSPLASTAIFSPPAVEPDNAAPTDRSQDLSRSQSLPLNLSEGRLRRWFAVAVAAAFFVLLLGIVLRVLTREGTLIVEVNEPGATLQVLSEEGKVTIERQGIPGQVTIGVDPGKHRLRVEKDGFQVFTQEFTLGAGGKETITVKLLAKGEAPKLLVAPPPADEADPHRKVARWLLSNGAWIRVRVNEDTSDVISSADRLPKEPFSLKSAILHPSGCRIGDAELETLAALCREIPVEDLNIPGSVTDAGLAHLSGMNVYGLTLSGNSQISNNGLKHLKTIHDIDWLDLSSTSISDEGMQEIASLVQLTGLGLSATSVGDKGLAHLSTLHSLKVLLLVGTRVTTDGLALLKKNHPDLVQLVLSGTGIQDDGAKHLAGLPRLALLAIDDTRIGDTAVNHLQPLAELTDLMLAWTQITDESLRTLAANPARREKLQVLNVSGTKVTDNGLQSLAELTNLKTLTLEHTQITDTGLTHLFSLKNLQELDVSNTGVTARGVQALKAALPNCNVKSGLIP